MASIGGRRSVAEKGKGIQVFPDPSSELPPASRLMESGIRAGRGAESCESSGSSDDDDGPVGSGSDEGSPSDSEVSDRLSRRPAPAIERMTPFRCNCDGTSEELSDLDPKFDRSHLAKEYDWGDVDSTHSDLEGVSSLMEKSRASGVTFMIPTPDQRPWTPPVGYCCVYESFFGEDSRLWFPIPRLITSYCRRGIALSQLMNGAVRIAVALMVMAAEIDVSMSVRVFEELTQTQPKPNGFIRPRIKTKRWRRSYFYITVDEAGFEDPRGVDRRFLWNRDIVGHPNTFGPLDAFRRDLPKLVALRLQEWRSFDRKRILRQQRRIARFDWEPYIPCEKSKGKRLKLPLMGTFSNVFDPTTNVAGTGSVAVDTLVGRDSTPASVAASPIVEGHVDAPPPKKKRKRSSKTRTVPPLDGDERDVTRSPRGPRGDNEVESDREEAHVMGSLSPVRGLSLGGGVATCRDNLVAGYEAVLRKMTLDLEKAKEEIRVKGSELETVQREKLDGVKELETAHSKIRQLERERNEDLERTKRAMERMRQSRNRELLSERKCVVASADRRFEKFRRYMADRDRKEEKRLLHGTALGTLNAVTMLEKRGLPIPRELKDLLTANEETFRKEAEEVTVEVITESDLALSPYRSASTVAPRSPIFDSVAPHVTQASTVACRPTATLSGGHTGASDRPFGTVSGPFGVVSGRLSHDDSIEEPEEAGTAETGDAHSSDPAVEA
ncbi:hypothetical protein Bca52824_014737 [Brassica carinata]|uniref:Uncharacterized protein n=1 Tax=Brassica carinata TaxID=52824 RepID=A0A8X7W0P4_BRACI|nr:hypothetical protein Bca52824_014737 [Brassica carinata]